MFAHSHCHYLWSENGWWVELVQWHCSVSPVVWKVGSLLLSAHHPLRNYATCQVHLVCFVPFLSAPVRDASQRFYNSSLESSSARPGEDCDERLNETVHPERKRKIIGDTFVRVSALQTVMLFCNPYGLFRDFLNVFFWGGGQNDFFLSWCLFNTASVQCNTSGTYLSKCM